jgi:hypothetical protein
VSSPTRHQHLPINQYAREMIVAYIICGPCHCSADGSILQSKCRVTRPLNAFFYIMQRTENWCKAKNKWVTSFVCKCGGGEMSALNTLRPLFLESSRWFITCKVATSRAFVKQKCIHKPAVSQSNRNRIRTPGWPADRLTIASKWSKATAFHHCDILNDTTALNILTDLGISVQCFTPMSCELARDPKDPVRVSHNRIIKMLLLPTPEYPIRWSCFTVH